MFDGYVLLGGKSSRMGEDKAFLRLGDQTFIERAVSALKSIAGERICLLVGSSNRRAATPWLTEDLPQITDVYSERGALGGLHAAFAHAKNEWAAILACDYPFVTTKLFAHFANIAEAVSPEVAAIVPIQPDGRVQPLCALYRVKPRLSVATELLIQKEAPPVRELLKSVATHQVQFKELAHLPNAELFFLNINTRSDYVHAQEIYISNFK